MVSDFFVYFLNIFIIYRTRLNVIKLLIDCIKLHEKGNLINFIKTSIKIYIKKRCNKNQW